MRAMIKRDMSILGAFKYDARLQSLTNCKSLCTLDERKSNKTKSDENENESHLMSLTSSRSLPLCVQLIIPNVLNLDVSYA